MRRSTRKSRSRMGNNSLKPGAPADEPQDDPIEAGTLPGPTTGSRGSYPSTVPGRQVRAKKIGASRQQSDWAMIPAWWSCGDESFSSDPPPHALFDVIVPMLSRKQFVIVQLVCKSWRDAVRPCLKFARPMRQEVNLGRLVVSHPNITALDLSLVEGLRLPDLLPLTSLSSLKTLSLPTLEGLAEQAPRNGAVASPGITVVLRLPAGPARPTGPGEVVQETQWGSSTAGAATSYPYFPESPLTLLTSLLGKLQSFQLELCPALQASMLLSLTGLTDLCIDNMSCADVLQPLSRLRSLRVRRLASFAGLCTLTGLLALSISTDGYVQDYLSECAMLPQLLSLHLKSSSARVEVATAPSFDGWSQLSRLHTLELRAPTDFLLHGFPALAHLTALRALSLDLVSGAEDLAGNASLRLRLPGGLETLSISTDRGRAGGCLSLQLPPGCNLHSANMRLYWTALQVSKYTGPDTPVEADAGVSTPAAGQAPEPPSPAPPAGMFHDTWASGGHSTPGLHMPADSSTPSHQQHIMSAAAAEVSGGLPLPVPPPLHLTLDACFVVFRELGPPLRELGAGLRGLSLENCIGMEDADLRAITELRQLQDLSISGCRLLTDEGLSCLSELAALRSLRLRGPRKLSLHATQAFTRLQPLERRSEGVTCSFLLQLAGLRDLRLLMLKHLHGTEPCAMAAGLAALSCLTRLEVKDCPGMTDAVLTRVVPHLTSLLSLAVTYCEGVSSEGRAAVLHSLGPLLELDFEGCALHDATRPRPLPSHSTQARIDGDRGSAATVVGRPRHMRRSVSQHLQAHTHEGAPLQHEGGPDDHDDEDEAAAEEEALDTAAALMDDDDDEEELEEGGEEVRDQLRHLLQEPGRRVTRSASAAAVAAGAAAQVAAAAAPAAAMLGAALRRAARVAAQAEIRRAGPRVLTRRRSGAAGQGGGAAGQVCGADAGGAGDAGDEEAGAGPADAGAGPSRPVHDKQQEAGRELRHARRE